MNLSAPMIHAFLDNIRYITIELNCSIPYGTRDDVPREMDTSRRASLAAGRATTGRRSASAGQRPP
jgi:hypothetical protein